MLKNEDRVTVRNLMDQRVVYLIPEKNVRRDFAGFQSKEIEVGELRELWYKTGGAKLLQDYLAVDNQELAEEFGINEDLFTHEYSWTQEDVDNVLLKGSEDELADALDYAPRGIIETIIDRAVVLHISDMNKRKLIQTMTGRDISKKIEYMEILEADQPEEENIAAAPRRRVKQEKEVNTGRRAK